MDRLLVVEPRDLVMHFELGSTCSGLVRIRNVMHTMPVAFKVQTTSPNKYLVKPPCGIIAPLATAELEVVMHAMHDFPDHFPLTKDKFMVKSVVVPGGNCKDGMVPPAEWFDSYKKVVFVDARLRTILVGGGILRQLLAGPKSTMEDVRMVLESEVDVDGVDDIGRSAMHLAVATGRPELVQLLLEYAPNLETKSRQGRTALHQAAESGEALMVEILLSKGADPNAADAGGRTALHLALVGGHLDVVRILLDKGANPDAPLTNGRTPIHVAVEEGLRKSLRVLLECGGAHPDAVIPSSGQTALHLAALRNDKATVKALVRAGANPRVRNRRGATPADLAAESGHGKLLEALELGHALREAARRGDGDAVQCSLDMGARVDGQDGRGWAALHRAAFKGHLQVVELLLAAGADVGLKDLEGHSPLHCAVEAGQVEVVRRLLAAGADSEAVNGRGTSALGMARHLHLPAVLRVMEGDKQVLDAASPTSGSSTPRGVLVSADSSTSAASSTRRARRRRVVFNLEPVVDTGPPPAAAAEGMELDVRPAAQPEWDHEPSAHEEEAADHDDHQQLSAPPEKAAAVVDDDYDRKSWMLSPPRSFDASSFDGGGKMRAWEELPPPSKLRDDSADYSWPTKTPSVNIHITFCNVDMSRCQRLVNA